MRFRMPFLAAFKTQFILIELLVVGLFLIGLVIGSVSFFTLLSFQLLGEGSALRRRCRRLVLRIPIQKHQCSATAVRIAIRPLRVVIL